MKYRFNYSYLQKYHSDHWSHISEFNEFIQCPLVFPLCSWAQDAVDWWNEWISTTGPRRKQLYLWGPTSVGKTTLIEKIMNIPYDSIYLPDVGKFMMAGFRPDVHKLILFEEFNLTYYHEDLLKRLTEGRPFGYSINGLAPRTIQFDGPIMFVSNHVPNMSDAFRSRLLF